MKEILIFLTISACFNVGLMQQCRQMTVCDEDNVSGGREKGDVGAPGKAGPQGIKGNKGELGGFGMKGIQGDSCALGSFESEMRQKLADLENLLISSPSSCLASSLYGKQTLRSGEVAFCDGAGWTVFQYRFNGSVNFNVGWERYKVGFGSFNGEFWLGLENVYKQTTIRGCKLRVDLWNSANDHEYAEYSSFSIEDESDFYRLHIDGFNGTARDRLAYHNNMPFTTRDRDNDNIGSNCASSGNNGWWFNACSYSRLNADWPRMNWGENKIISVMKFRCD